MISYEIAVPPSLNLDFVENKVTTLSTDTEALVDDIVHIVRRGKTLGERRFRALSDTE